MKPNHPIAFLECDLSKLTESWDVDLKAFFQRKFTGMSLHDVDRFIDRGYKVTTHAEKVELIDDISDVIREAEHQLSKTEKEVDRRKVADHISALKLVKSKISSIDIIGHTKEKEETGGSGEENRTLNIDKEL